jgi:O-antigen/teichoic acid export membrane protein
MDLNTLITSGFRVLGSVAVPLVIYFEGGIVGAVTVLLISNLLILVAHLFVSGRLLDELLRFSFDRTLIRPLLRFGGAFAVSGIAGVLLINLEKLVLTRVTSVETLAHYSVAFAFASMATMFSTAMLQSLIPAFSQLLDPERHSQMKNLFSRALRANLISLLPVVTILFVIARPFFSIWAGEEFGRQSTLPFYILLGGLFFNILAFVPLSVILASGRTDILAKLYWLELFPYIGLIAVLTLKFGAAGAAAAWSVRVILDAMLIGWFSQKVAGISFNIFTGKTPQLFLGMLILLPPIVIAITNEFLVWSLMMLPISLSIYFLFTWKQLLEPQERLWLSNGIQMKIAGRF